QPETRDGRPVAVGDPTEGALLVAAAQAGLRKEDLERRLPREDELPFDSDRKRMTTLHRLPDDPSRLDEYTRPFHRQGVPYLAITKGAVDGLLDVATRIWAEAGPEPLDGEWRERIHAANDEMA